MAPTGVAPGPPTRVASGLDRKWTFDTVCEPFSELLLFPPLHLASCESFLPLICYAFPLATRFVPILDVP